MFPFKRWTVTIVVVIGILFLTSLIPRTQNYPGQELCIGVDVASAQEPGEDDSSLMEEQEGVIVPEPAVLPTATPAAVGAPMPGAVPGQTYIVVELEGVAVYGGTLDGAKGRGELQLVTEVQSGQRKQLSGYPAGLWHGIHDKINLGAEIPIHKPIFIVPEDQMDDWLAVMVTAVENDKMPAGLGAVLDSLESELGASLSRMLVTALTENPAAGSAAAELLPQVSNMVRGWVGAENDLWGTYLNAHTRADNWDVGEPRWFERSELLSVAYAVRRVQSPAQPLAVRVVLKGVRLDEPSDWSEDEVFVWAQASDSFRGARMTGQVVRIPPGRETFQRLKAGGYYAINRTLLETEAVGPLLYVEVGVWDAENGNDEQLGFWSQTWYTADPSFASGLMRNPVYGLEGGRGIIELELQVERPSPPVVPTVKITAPAAGATLSPGETVSVDFEAHSGQGFERAQLLVDGNLVQEKAIQAPDSAHLYSNMLWAAGPAGAHTLAVRVYDYGGKAATSEAVAVQVGAPTMAIGPGELGQVMTMALDESDPLRPILYAGTDHMGVYKSTDGGRGWVPANRGIENGEVVALALDPTNPQVLYAALIDTTYGGPQGGVFKTVNGGGNWQLVSEAQQVWALAPAPSESQVLYASSPFYGGVRKSTDGGATWMDINIPDVLVVESLAVNPWFSHIIYAGTRTSGLYRNVEGSWASISLGLPPGVSISDILIDDQVYSGNVIYVGTSTAGIYKNTNFGVDPWTPINTGLATSLITTLA
ncbi:MAG: Ig-like domain-containing protein, partial [Anaerolineae bacterium]